MRWSLAPAACAQAAALEAQLGQLSGEVAQLQQELRDSKARAVELEVAADKAGMR